MRTTSARSSATPCRLCADAATAQAFNHQDDIPDGPGHVATSWALFGAVLPFEQADPGSVAKAEALVYNPAYDYVPPELVSLLITNQGAHLPAYIYRLLAEVYHQEDHFLSPSS